MDYLTQLAHEYHDAKVSEDKKALNEVMQKIKVLPNDDRLEVEELLEDLIY